MEVSLPCQPLSNRFYEINRGPPPVVPMNEARLSKKSAYRTHQCVYCALRPATVVEHIFAKKFFVLERRADLPTAPACEECNTKKSKLEMYLMSVMPFGCENIDGPDALAAAEPRLAKNPRLHRELIDGHSVRLGFRNGKIAPVMMTVPIEPDKVLQFFEYAAKGLMFWHWKASLQLKHKCKAHFLSGEGELRLNKLLSLKRTTRVNVNLGEGTYAYEGVQSQDAPELTVWKFQMMGSASLEVRPGLELRYVGVLTGSGKLVDSFIG